MDRSQAGKLGYEKTQHILKQRSEEKSRRVVEEYEANPKYCPTCGEKIVFERRRAKFCDSSCAATYNNSGRNGHLNSVRLKPSHLCVCGKTCARHNQYCADCIAKHVYNQVGSTEEARTDRSRKRIVIEVKGYRCAICEISDWMAKPIKLELDHIDGNADNNSMDNLRLLCPNCHSQTDTYKYANKGKNSSRQQMRRQRYADGKTY